MVVRLLHLSEGGGVGSETLGGTHLTQQSGQHEHDPRRGFDVSDEAREVMLHAKEKLRGLSSDAKRQGAKIDSWIQKTARQSLARGHEVWSELSSL